MRILRVKSEADFYSRVKGGDLNLAIIIVDAILTNLDSKKKHNYIVTIELEEEEETYDLTCHSDEFLFTLEKNLQILAEGEMYEKCQEVVEAIKYLKNKSYDVQV